MKPSFMGPTWISIPSSPGRNPFSGRTRPIYVGGESDAALARLARFGDAWFPRSNTSPEKLREVRRWLTAQGRPDVPFTIFGAGKDPAKLAGYADGGVERITFLLETMPESETLAELDVLAQLRPRVSAGE